MALSSEDLEKLFEMAAKTPGPFQGDRVYIEGDVCETLAGHDVINNAGQSAAFVWKMRGFPELPVPRMFANTSVTLVGDASRALDWIVLPIDWKEQEGLDLKLRLPASAVKVDLDESEYARHADAAYRRQAVAAFGYAFVLEGVDEQKYGWMLRPSPVDSIRSCALGLAEVFMDSLLEEYPNQLVALESLGIPIHRDWPVNHRYRSDPDPFELWRAREIVTCALEGGKEPGVRGRVKSSLGIPDWSVVNLDEAFAEALDV